MKKIAIIVLATIALGSCMKHNTITADGHISVSVNQMLVGERVVAFHQGCLISSIASWVSEYNNVAPDMIEHFSDMCIQEEIVTRPDSYNKVELSKDVTDNINKIITEQKNDYIEFSKKLENNGGYREEPKKNEGILQKKNI